MRVVKHNGNCITARALQNMIKYPFCLEDIPFDDKTGYKDDLEEYNSSHVKCLFPIIDNRIIHVCNIRSLVSILKDKYIYPNNGKYKTSFHTSEYNIGYLNNWICLFNFKVDQFDAYLSHHVWKDFLTEYSPHTFILFLKEESLQNLVQNPFLPHSEVSGSNCIPYVEVWHKEPISVDHIDEIAFVPHRKPSQYIFCKLENFLKSVREGNYENWNNL
jgi:hypothetical protein